MIAKPLFLSSPQTDLTDSYLSCYHGSTGEMEGKSDLVGFCGTRNFLPKSPLLLNTSLYGHAKKGNVYPM